ncbi:MAG: FIST C-terminal domain-containing protein [Chroococcidiopsidaceae cyanobacterium CP_BM_ER_R8_30]|nr:FIST C-terminal domain-containing protein [Chroococcidiopsidaceae cyanobacterium CP_BM_ER_R8_30]
MVDQMRWTNALSTRPSLESAITEVVERALDSLGCKADLGLVFISSAFTSEYSRLLPLLQERLSVPALIGCSGGGIIGMNPQGQTQEIEESPALSLSLAHLPKVDVEAFHLAPATLPDLDSPPDAWVELTNISPSKTPQFILLSDPFTEGVNDLLQGLDFAYPQSVKVGGQASGSSAMSGKIGLFCNNQMYREGTVGVALSGNVVMETIVAQGCRPIGKPYTVSKGERNILLELEDLPPLFVLQNLIEGLSEQDRQLAQRALFVGIARDEFKQDLEQGDFLIRTLLGVDPQAGAIAIGARIRPGQRVQFHLRDAQTSREDLEWLLQCYQQQTKENQEPAGALMFSCLGRGEGLYGKPNFDSQLFSHYLSDIPIGGFFCNGEIGPVGGSTFLHGFTSVFGICRQATEESRRSE